LKTLRFLFSRFEFNYSAVIENAMLVSGERITRATRVTSVFQVTVDVTFSLHLSAEAMNKSRGYAHASAERFNRTVKSKG
jgi:hypothetical protein